MITLDFGSAIYEIYCYITYYWLITNQHVSPSQWIRVDLSIDPCVFRDGVVSRNRLLDGVCLSVWGDLCCLDRLHLFVEPTKLGENVSIGREG